MTRMESTRSFDIAVEEVGINPGDILRTLGYSQSSVPEPVLEKINTLLPASAEYAEPKGGFVIFTDLTVSIRTDCFSVGDIQFNSGDVIATQLVGSEIIGAIVATAGSGVTDASRRLIDKGELLEAYIVDAIGSLVAENAADFVQKHIEEQVAQIGLKITNRLSPGYCGWDVSEQHKLFSLLPEQFCGVSLNESALMIPIKSISAVVGIGKSVEKGPYPCSVCAVEKCYMRK